MENEEINEKKDVAIAKERSKEISIDLSRISLFFEEQYKDKTMPVFVFDELTRLNRLISILKSSYEVEDNNITIYDECAISSNEIDSYKSTLENHKSFMQDAEKNGIKPELIDDFQLPKISYEEWEQKISEAKDQEQLDKIKRDLKTLGRLSWPKEIEQTIWNIWMSLNMKMEQLGTKPKDGIDTSVYKKISKSVPSANTVEAQNAISSIYKGNGDKEPEKE